MLLNDGNINGTQVVDPDVIAATWSLANVNHHNDDDDDIQRPRSVLPMFILALVTARQRSCGNVMFSVVCVCVCSHLLACGRLAFD